MPEISKKRCLTHLPVFPNLNSLFVIWVAISSQISKKSKNLRTTMNERLSSYLINYSTTSFLRLFNFFKFFRNEALKNP